MFLATLSNAYTEETITQEDGKTDERIVLKFPPELAPVKLAILPLLKKDGLPDKAREILNDIKYDVNCIYEEKDSIGKRYRRQDAIGTPYCITIDHQTLEDNTVTLRDRDTMAQERIPVEKVREIVLQKTSMNYLLKKLD
jgi:glycyl-tRNA synthetase